MRGVVRSCVCGDSLWKDVTQVGCPLFPKAYPIDVLQCENCNVLVQRVEMTRDELAAWYAERYHAGIYSHSFSHDRDVAGERVRAYGPKLKGRVLDVGCGRGAFVMECLDRGLEAEGQDLAVFKSKGDLVFAGGKVDQSVEDHFHSGPIEECSFPTDHYDAVTCHDVLEHVPDPMPFLAECKRALKPGGWFILDFPDFREARHWKPIEHLWLFGVEELTECLKRAGFDVRYMTRPVPGKLCFYSTKAAVKRPSILLPPGIGDSYWSVVKMPGFAETIGADVVDLWLSDPDDKQRSLEWIRKIPWAAAKGYIRHRVTAPAFQEAYMQNGRYLFKDVQGCDYFMAFNGVMRHGKDIDEIEREWGSEWFPRMHVSPTERAAERGFRNRFGPYVVAYFVEHGMYRGWLEQMNVGRISKELRAIKERGFEVVFMGAGWDVNGLPSMLAGAIGGVDLCGETSIDEMFALIKGARGVIGWPAGNTIMATVLKTETLMFWNSYFDKRFWKFSCPPESRGEWYHWADTRNDPGPAIAAFMERIGSPSDG